MSPADDAALIAGAIRRLYADAGLPWPPPVERGVLPVPLDTLIGTYNLVHQEVPDLTRATAGSFLSRWGVHRPELLEDGAPLDGFLFANASSGYILVRADADNGVPRRRFTAAHELGHYLLHFLPRLQAPHDAEVFLVRDDGKESVREEEQNADGPSLSERERQANQFAAELLMPESACRAAYERFNGGGSRTVGRFLEHHLARDLLVSREAMRWRLRRLGLAP